jgi:hypothetical protein
MSCDLHSRPGVLQLEQTGRELRETAQMTPPCDVCDSKRRERSGHGFEGRNQKVTWMASRMWADDTRGMGFVQWAPNVVMGKLRRTLSSIRACPQLLVVKP